MKHPFTIRFMVFAAALLLLTGLTLSATVGAGEDNVALPGVEEKPSDEGIEAQATGDIISSFAAPASRPWGLAWDGTYLWLSSEGNDTIYKLDPTTGGIVNSFAAPTTFPTGLTFDGTHLWLSEYGGSTLIYKIDPITGAVVSSFTSPTTVSGWTDGLAFDGTNLWITGFGDPNIYRVNPSTGAVLGTIPAPGEWSRDITWDGTHLWVVNTNPNGAIYQILPSDGSVVSSFTLPSVGFPIGITFDGQYLWVSGLSDNTIYQVDIEFVPLAVSGCIYLQGSPLKDARVILKQKDEDKQRTRTDADGCYTFDNIVSGKKFKVLIKGPVVP